MYIPEHFRVTDMALIEQFIRDNGLATLISSGAHYPFATHLPLELEVNEDGEKILYGHMARANPHWESFASYPQVTAVFLSDINHYISSSWYDHPNVPTWNYISVQASGIVKVLKGTKKWGSVKRLTDRYESFSENPVSLEALPRHVKAEIGGLVAFEIKIEYIEAAFKLSQNRDDRNYRQIIDGLLALGDAGAKRLAEYMQKCRYA